LPSYSFTDQYKYEIFLLWFNAGKPRSGELRRMIPEALGDRKPTVDVLRIWIKERFIPQAEQMDKEISEQLESRMVKEKVEMLSRHANLGTKMQDIGIDYIEANKSDLTANAAVRLLIEGVRIERDSRGLPQAIEKMMNQSDEELLEEVQQLVEGSQVEILEEE
jgi:hypothetical protein